MAEVNKMTWQELIGSNPYLIIKHYEHYFRRLKMKGKQIDYLVKVTGHVEGIIRNTYNKGFEDGQAGLQEACDRARQEGFEDGKKQLDIEQSLTAKEAYKKGYHEGKMSQVSYRYADDRQTECLLTDEECVEDRKRVYQQGLNDAWECARKIAELGEFKQTEVFDIKNCYPSKQTSDILNTYSASEAIDKIKTMDNDIQVGDEVTYYKQKGIVTKANTDEDYYTVMSVDGGRMITDCKDSLAKTGRHFPELVELFKKMGDNE